MPAYDYRCTACGTVMELVHSMRETVEHRAHAREDGAACDGALERLIGPVGVNAGGRTEKSPSDAQLQRTGFTKYVRGSKGYEKAFGSGPSFVQRE